MSRTKVGAGDAAHAETVLPFAPAVLLDLLEDCERLLRLNPCYAIDNLTPDASGFRLSAYNESNERRIESAVRVERPHSHQLVLHYASGLKQATCFVVAADGAGVRLSVTEHYPRIENPQDVRVAEVDKSLVPWVAALRRHVLARQRWGWLPGWRWWHERFMLGMPPRQRRIVRLLIWTSLLEFCVFIGLVFLLRLAA